MAFSPNIDKPTSSNACLSTIVYVDRCQRRQLADFPSNIASWPRTVGETEHLLHAARRPSVDWVNRVDRSTSMQRPTHQLTDQLTYRLTSPLSACSVLFVITAGLLFLTQSRTNDLLCQLDQLDHTVIALFKLISCCFVYALTGLYIAQIITQMNWHGTAKARWYRCARETSVPICVAPTSPSICSNHLTRRYVTICQVCHACSPRLG